MYVCSPLKGDLERNIRRANGYCRFAAYQGVVPLAPHVAFSQFLDDDIPEERELGMQMGLELLKHCQGVWVFGARISEGMAKEIAEAERRGIPIRYFSDKCEKLS
ncbi:conserved hypothetical protein [Candidatus Desulfosporosinus infrequens]|uniref:DUF7768 domain-containing protein n=1 Tax=Candidatus Desulfosporosinus infrequens TaxID=2043169 RepID=A0A2U3LS95_9FIRM|nr:conserved hypothetical protein [Candidatus Desulfosporosinus infrequens]